ncbi:helix-turn-helix domain-containing protein [Ferrimonas marina]|uniref:cAMP-binding domain of CRP or a regulatory subunit of cAMP-dependent protein kinases n=1 Tax=Ferrimonas marina TaxID=299255 RepID=A0A1M5XW64_9GAMM|nr:helix-turn-helix domain-containing protein [Ferrimonas marina]SHI03493.1 cAMP-binding domain of CRP or a regulatory subunit of cAMP-dependent protein kinases [Ferrimonas marina]
MAAVSQSKAQIELRNSLMRHGLHQQAALALSELSHTDSMAAGETAQLDTDQLGLALIHQGTLMRQVMFHDGSIGSTELRYSGQLVFSPARAASCDNNVRYRCLEPAYYSVVSTQALNEQCRADARLLEFVFERQHVYQRMVEDRMLLRSVLSKREHIIMVLVMVFSSKLKRGEQLIRVTLEDLCTVSGATRQYYSRVISALCRQGILVNHYGALELLDYNRLKAELGETARKHYELVRNRPEHWTEMA